MKIKIKKKDGLSTTFRRTIRSMKDARGDTMKALQRDWSRVVRESTWLYPKPSPESLVISRYSVKSARTLRVGWIDYPGSHRAARARLILRKPIMDRRASRSVPFSYKLRVKK